MIRTLIRGCFPAILIVAGCSADAIQQPSEAQIEEAREQHRAEAREMQERMEAERGTPRGR